MKFNPHIHALVTQGAMDAGGAAKYIEEYERKQEEKWGIRAYERRKQAGRTRQEEPWDWWNEDIALEGDGEQESRGLDQPSARTASLKVIEGDFVLFVFTPSMHIYRDFNNSLSPLFLSGHIKISEAFIHPCIVRGKSHFSFSLVCVIIICYDEKGRFVDTCQR